jgi:hypothetical protein
MPARRSSEIFFWLSEGHFHNKHFSSSRHRLLTSPIRGLGRDAGRVPREGLGRHVSVKQERKTPYILCMAEILIILYLGSSFVCPNKYEAGWNGKQ